MVGTGANPNPDGAGSSRGTRARNVGDRACQQGPVGTGVQVPLPNPPPLRPPPVQENPPAYPPPPQPPVYPPQLPAYSPPSLIYHPYVPAYPPKPSVHYQPQLEYGAPPIHQYNYHRYVPPVGHNQAPPEYVRPEVHYQGYHLPQMAYQYRAPVYPHPAYQAPYYHAYGHVPPVHHHGPNSHENAPIFNILNKSRINSYSAGSKDPTEAENCIKDVKRLLENREFPKEKWVLVAKSLMMEAAHHCLEMVERSKDNIISWEQFQEQFLKEYFPQAKQSEKAAEFLKLNQEKSSCSKSLPLPKRQKLKGAVMQPTATQRSANPRSPMKKRPKIAKVVQSASCEVCKVDCNSKDVLDKPKEGKKLIAASKPAPPPPPPPPPQVLAPDSTSDASATCNNTIIGPQENPSEGKSSGSKRGKSRAAETEGLETKKEKKMLEGGADAEAARWCDKCRVVCDSETVFSYHLSGLKHAFMEKWDAITMRRIEYSGHLMIL